MNKLFAKLLVASSASVTVTEAVNLEPLWNALITLAVSLVSVLTIEGIAWLRAWFKGHTPKDKQKEEHARQLEEADEVVEIVQEEHKED